RRTFRSRVAPSVLCPHAKHITHGSIPRRLVIITEEILFFRIRRHPYDRPLRLYFRRNCIHCQLVCTLDILLNSRNLIQLVVNHLFNIHRTTFFKNLFHSSNTASFVCVSPKRRASIAALSATSGLSSRYAILFAIASTS